MQRPILCYGRFVCFFWSFLMPPSFIITFNFYSVAFRTQTQRFAQTVVLLFLLPFKNFERVWFSQGATSKDVKIIITSSVDDRSLLDSQEEAVSSGQYALFQRRTPLKEISHHVFRDKRDSPISSEGARFVIPIRMILAVAFSFLLLSR